MDDTTALAAPPPITIHPRGAVMTAVADVLRNRLPGAQVVPPGGAEGVQPPEPAAPPDPRTPAAEPPTPAAAATFTSASRRGIPPVLVLLSGDTSAAQAESTLAEVAARHPRQARVWIGVDARTTRTTLQALDDLLDAVDQPRVDAVVVLPAASAEATALAAQAWIWLRHDAPSSALVDLRDANGACRFAAIAATAPASPPFADEEPAAPAVAPAGSGEHALLLVGRGLDEVAEAARRTASDHTARVVAADRVVAPTELNPPPAIVAPEVLDGAVAALTSEGGTALRAAQQFCAEAATADALPQQETLTATVLAAVQAETAWSVESSRTGLASKLGRRKRLERARVDRDAARRAWAVAYVDVAVEAARRVAAGQIAPRVAQAAQAAEGRAQQRTAEQRSSANQRWLLQARATGAAVQPPGQVDPEGLSRAWGRAAPAIRRYLLVPTEPPTASDAHERHQEWIEAAGPGEDGVSVTFAPDLTGPIAAALVMGVPLTALRVGQAQGGATG